MSTAYTQTAPYIPETDPAFRDWLLNFSTLISADPNKYGLEAADATVIAAQYTAFNDAYTAVQMPSTRTPSAVAQKDAQRASAVGTVRVYAQMIKANGGVNNQDKVDLGIHVNDPTPTPIPAPTSTPIISIVGATSGQHELRYADENTPASRRKPDGVIQMQLNMAVGASPATNPEDAEFVALHTRQPVRVQLDPGSVGQTATYFARWVTRTGKVGPWSLPVSMTIAFSGGADATTGGGTTQTEGSESIKIAA